MLQKASLHEYFTKAELAQYLSTSERTINNWIKRGLPHFRVGSKILRFKRSEVDLWLERFRSDEESEVDKIVNEILG